MHILENSLNRELRIQKRKVQKLKREMQDLNDYFQEIVFLVNDEINKDI